MVVTRDTSHLEMSPETFDESKTSFMSVTPETTQEPIGPCEPLEQPKSDAFMHAAMTAWSSAFDLGANTVVAVAYYLSRGPVGYVCASHLTNVVHCIATKGLFCIVKKKNVHLILYL